MEVKNLKIENAIIHMVQVLEKKKQNEISPFCLGKHVPEIMSSREVRNCVLLRTNCYFSRCWVNVCLQKKSFKGMCMGFLGLLGQVPLMRAGGDKQQKCVSPWFWGLHV